MFLFQGDSSKRKQPIWDSTAVSPTSKTLRVSSQFVPDNWFVVFNGLFVVYCLFQTNCFQRFFVFLTGAGWLKLRRLRGEAAAGGGSAAARPVAVNWVIRGWWAHFPSCWSFFSFLRRGFLVGNGKFGLVLGRPLGK